MYVVMEKDYFGYAPTDCYTTPIAASPEKKKAEAYAKKLIKQAEEKGQAEGLIYYVMEVQTC